MRYVDEYKDGLPVARIEGTISDVGKTQDIVRCSCGYLNHFFRWSWAGHGIAKCKNCGSRIEYGTLRIRPDRPDKIISKLRARRKEAIR